MAANPLREERAPVPLLGPTEKSELEELILRCLTKHCDASGTASLLEPGVRVVVHASGPEVVTGAAAVDGALAAVEVRTLFTALCHLAAEGPLALPRESLPALAAEATTATAAQINRLAPD